LEESANKRRIGRVFSIFPSLGVLAVLAVIVVLVAAISPGHYFIHWANIEAILTYYPEFTIIVLGAGLLMICGEFDLSVGSILVISSFVFAWLLGSGINPFIAALIALAGGAITGLLNGLITVKGRIPSFITTLGTMMLWRGVILIITGGSTHPADAAGFPVFYTLLTGELGGLFPVQAAWFVLFAVIFGLLLHRHKFGNWRAGDGWELRVIAAVVVGGTSLRGGVGSMTGIILGSLIIVVITNAITLLRLPFGWTFVVFGSIIVLSVLLDRFIERIRMRYV
jgi:simple sugar transport system permease protein